MISEGASTTPPSPPPGSDGAGEAGARTAGGDAVRESREDQHTLAAEGALLEKDVIAMMPAWQSLSLPQMVASIRSAGAAHCVLATDFGQLHHPVPPEGLRMFIQLLLEQGITADEIRMMVADNPARLLGL